MSPLDPARLALTKAPSFGDTGCDGAREAPAAGDGRSRGRPGRARGCQPDRRAGRHGLADRANQVDQWRQGRVEYLEQAVQANQPKVSTAMKLFRQWANAGGLVPSKTDYVARTRDRRPLRFSESGDPGTERLYRTQWVSPTLSEDKRRRLAERQSKPPRLVVIMPLREFTCSGAAEAASSSSSWRIWVVVP